MKQFLTIFLLALLFASCSEDDVLDLSQESDFTISAIAASIDGSSLSRVSYSPEYLESGLIGNLKVTWDSGDSFKLYEATGDDYTTPTGIPLATFTIQDQYAGKNYGVFISDTQLRLDNSKHYLAVWELEESDDCKYIEHTPSLKKKYLVQYGDDNTDHLKYGDKMIAKISYKDNTINTNVDGTTSASFPELVYGNVTQYIHFYHPEHFVMRVKMNNFLYDIKEGALLRVFGLKGHELQHSAQVRLQCENSNKGDTTRVLIDVDAANSSEKLRYLLGYASEKSSLNTTFTAYIICEENILEGVDEILFSLCDDKNDYSTGHGKSTQDRYVWQLKMPGDFDFKHGEFWKFDLTQYTCRPALRLTPEDDICWAVTDLGSNELTQRGYYYQAMNPTPVAKNDTDILSADLSPDTYYKFFSETYDYTHDQVLTETQKYWTICRSESQYDNLSDDTLLLGLFQKGDDFYKSNQGTYYGMNLIADADPVYLTLGGMWTTPTAANMKDLTYGSYKVRALTSEGFNGCMVTYGVTGHSIYLNYANVYHLNNGVVTALSSNQAIFVTRTFSANSGEKSDKDRIVAYLFPVLDSEGKEAASLTNFQFFKAGTLRPVLNIGAMHYASQ